MTRWNSLSRWRVSVFAIHANDYPAALRSMEECLESYRRLGSPKLITRGRVAVGQMLVALGDVERTEPLARETLAEGRANASRSLSITPCITSATLPCGAAMQARRCSSTGELARGTRLRKRMEAAAEVEGMGLAGEGREEEAFRLLGASNARFAELQVTVMDEITFWVQLRERYFHPVRERVGGAAADKWEEEITGIDSLEILDQACEAARSFQPLSDAARSAVLAKTKEAAARGEYELFKTRSIFDSSAQNP